MSGSKPTALITGANGFVGSRLARKLIDNGVDVIAGVRKTADLSLLDGLNVQYRYGDVTQPETLPAMVSGVDYIIHNAGIVKARRDDDYFAVNEHGTRNLLEAIASHNPSVRKAVYVSSLAAAGPSTVGNPRCESDPPSPITAYGRSKLRGEEVLLSFADRFNVVVVRAAGVYGPGDKEILTFFKSVHSRLKPYIGNINRTIQLVHVDDLCVSIYKALISETQSGRVFFVAENSAYTMKELIRLLEIAVGRKSFPLWIPTPLFYVIAFFSEWAMRLVGVTPMLTVEKAGELLASWEVSTKRAESELRFVSEIPFERGARETYQWYLQHGWLK